MSTFDTANWLAGLLGHLNQHPHLADTLGSIDGRDHRLQLRNDLADLEAWSRTLTDLADVEITCVRGDGQPYTHLRLTGRLADETPVWIVACLLDPDSDLLEANTSVAEDTKFPVELLHKLTAASRPSGEVES